MTRTERIPEGVSAVLPMLVCRDVSAEIDFCKTTVNALEVVRRTGPDGEAAHAALTINGAMIMIECEWPTLSSRSLLPNSEVRRGTTLIFLEKVREVRNIFKTEVKSDVFNGFVCIA
jgi:uncharacterized glyoxalase superfamily protein PhnB